MNKIQEKTWHATLRQAFSCTACGKPDPSDRVKTQQVVPARLDSLQGQVRVCKESGPQQEVIFALCSPVKDFLGMRLYAHEKGTTPLAAEADHDAV